MSSRIVVISRCVVATCIALAFTLCLLGAVAAAQVTIQPQDEVFGGYSWLHTNGYAAFDDIGYKVPDITDGFDLSNTYYFPQEHNLGVLADFSYHFNGNNTVVAGTGSKTSVFYMAGGLQYKYHTDTFSPFVRVFVGAADHRLPASSQWSPEVGGGGGIDLTVTRRFSIRLAQVDYIYSNYTPPVLSGHDSQWNSIRLAAGLVVNLGTYYNPPLSCTASATPAEVFAPDPVKVTTTGTNFPPKDALIYAWTANGGKLSPDNAQSANIDTTGVAPGNYSANSTISDPKLKNHDSGVHTVFFGKPEPMKPAMCAASFTIKQPLPPVVSCSANPTTIAIGEPSTITMTATDPQGWPMTYSWSTTGGTLSGSGTTATLTATNADAGNTITVTGTATTNRPGGNPATLSSSCTASVNVPAVQKCAVIEDWGECTFEKNPKKPWRVDNDCKDTLDKLSLRLQQMPNGKLDIVGYTNEKEVVSEQTLGSQRSVNVKYYLTTDGPNKADASRIQPRQGGAKGQATHFYFVPEGNLCGGQLEEGTTVDETQVQPQSRNAPAPKKHKAKAKPAAPPAQ